MIKCGTCGPFTPSHSTALGSDLDGGSGAGNGNRLRPVPQELLEREPFRLRIAVDRLVPLRLDEDDVRLRAGDFFALFLVDVFLAEGFFADDDRVGDLLPPLFWTEVFLLDGFFAGDLLLDDVLFFCLRSRARAVPPIAAPSTAAPVAASTGFSATAPTTFFAPDATFLAPDPTTDAASPAFSFMVEMGACPSCSVPFVRSVAFAGVMCPPPSRSRSRSPLNLPRTGRTAVATPTSGPLTSVATDRNPVSSRSRRGPSGSAGRS
jgi:hypothetical protein